MLIRRSEPAVKAAGFLRFLLQFPPKSLKLLLPAGGLLPGLPTPILQSLLVLTAQLRQPLSILFFNLHVLLFDCTQFSAVV